jgi:membrane-associated phospholipid phosphatase
VNLVRANLKQACVFGLAVAVLAIASASASARVSLSATSQSTDPATWKPWHLSAADQFRLGPPPAAHSATTTAELRQILKFQAKRTAKTIAIIKKWNAVPATVPWSDAFLEAIKSYRPRPPAAAYDIALYYTGLYDAMIAACDTRNAYAKVRPAPSKLNRKIRPALKSSGPTYGSEQAAMAGAAETLLPYLFPDAPKAQYTAMATEAVNSRVWAGLNYPSDVTTSRTLGQKVAQLVITQAATDGRATSTGFPFPRLTGEQYWSPTPPAFEPPFGGPAGTWRPWLMSNNDQFLHAIPPPSKYGSPEFLQQVLAVLHTSQTETEQQKSIAFFWDDGPGTLTPPGHWISIAEDLVKQYHPSNEQAARIMAYVGAALADAGVEAWRVKYYYWQVRPITAIWRLCDNDTRICSEAEIAANPGIALHRNLWYSLITTPAFPSYPSAHSTFSGAASTVLEHFFPSAVDKISAMALEVTMARLYGLIHYPEDNANGLQLGKDIGGLAIQRAQADGAG